MHGPVVQRLGHSPFKAETGVRFSAGLPSGIKKDPASCEVFFYYAQFTRQPVTSDIGFRRAFRTTISQNQRNRRWGTIFFENTGRTY